MSKPLVYTPKEIQAELRVGRHTAVRLARELGVRVSPRRLIIPRIRLEEWLRGGEAMKNDPDPGERNARAGVRPASQ